MDLFAQPRKIENINAHNAYILGCDFASLATACYLIRDGKMKGEHIHIIDSIEQWQEENPYCPYLEKHSYYLWDLLRSIPSIETEGLTVLDEMNNLNQDDPVINQEVIHLSDTLISELVHFFLTSDEQLKNHTVQDVLSQKFLESDFYHYWYALFPVNDACTFKLTLHRYMHLLNSQNLVSPKYSIYQSIIVPMIDYLEKHHVIFHFNTEVTEITVHHYAESFTIKDDDTEETIGLTKSDLLFISSACHKMKKASENESLNIQEDASIMNAVVTTLDKKIIHYIKNILHKEPLSGHDMTGGMIPILESSWEMNWTVPRQPYYKKQLENQCVILLHGLNPHALGDFINKPMTQCTGWEICAEWLYHLGIPEDEILPLALTSSSTIPYVYHIEEKRVDSGGLNYRYIGRGVLFPGEYKDSLDCLAHTAMKAVYDLLHIQRSLPVSHYSLEDYLKAVSSLYGDTTFVENRSFTTRLVLKELLKRIEGNDLDSLLKEYKFY